jgi:hypothetical protein
MYYEKIPDDSALNCGTWKNKIYITENHLSYIEEYKKRFESSFEIAGPKTTFEAARLKTTSENVWPAFAAYDTTNKTFIEIKEPDQVREFGEPKYDVSPGDILEVIQTKTCRSGSGICWKVRNIKTGELGYVFAERMRKRHRVYKGDSNFEIAGPKTTSETVSPKTTSDSQLAGDGPQKLAYNVNLEEPWTGKWRVEGHSTFKGIWAMKQSGQIVKSTKDSYFKFEGIVRGNQLEGKLIGDANLTHNFIITLSSDGQSFKGITKGQHAPSSGPIKGKRE